MIQFLANSESFAETHSIIAKLRVFTDFSMTQLNEIVEAVITNSQIYWIIEDADVDVFVREVIKGKEEHIKAINLEKLNDLLSKEVVEEEIDWSSYI